MSRGKDNKHPNRCLLTELRVFGLGFRDCGFAREKPRTSNAHTPEEWPPAAAVPKVRLEAFKWVLARELNVS